ncbi:NAD-dependent epimerase/dehydratase family protein [Candidatus Lokiarchaeum ossiferum]|uniref:NAD-dependent epimerase/dehydratase family protein n=1 Tax=Candidatus Lokiarchaeum ossiferum TaxID=2951803 RepID=UPI00352EC6EB
MGKVFITGATGQVGSHLVEYLLENKAMGIEKPEDILCLVRTPQKALHLKSLRVTIIQGDLNDKSKIMKEFQDPTISTIFHVAANVYVYASYEEMYEANVLGTRTLLNCFIKSEIPTFIHTSSIIVYNASAASSIPEKKNYFEFIETSPIGTLNPDTEVPYAISKRIAELEVKKFARKYPHKKFIITRLGPIVGRGDRQIVPSLVKANSIKVPKLINHGQGKLSLTAPDDVARAQIFLANLEHKNNPEIFNIANTHLSFNTLFSIVAEFYGKNPPSVSIPLWIFKPIKPLLRLLQKCFPKNELMRTFFSASALEYLEKTYHYNSDKLLELGFKFQKPIDQAILEAIQEIEQEKK